MRFAIILTLTTFLCNGLWAQIEPVKWTFEAEKVNETEYDIVVTADIDNGWSVYSQHIDDQNAGPVPTQLNIENQGNIELVGKSKETGLKQESFDENFGMKLVKYSRKARFTQRVKVASDTSRVQGSLTYMTCDSESCLPPTDVDFNITLNESE